jgi:hypothetical protein
MYKWYLAKPFQAIVVNKSTVNELSKELEKQFVFYGIDENGNKCYDDDLSIYHKVGGYFYIKGIGTKKINDGDYIVLRHENFDIVTQEYFKRNFIELF